MTEEGDDYIGYSTDEAIRLAALWRAGKLIGGDEHEVIIALLNEIERLRPGVVEDVLRENG